MAYICRARVNEGSWPLNQLKLWNSGTIQWSSLSTKHYYFTGVTVLCTHYAMELTISRFVQPYLVISSLHLLDPDCKAIFANNTHALLRAPLEGCDTEQKISEDYFIYVNTMMGDTKSASSSALITREGRVHFEFQCLYRRIHVLSIVSYSSRQKLVRTSGGK